MAGIGLCASVLRFSATAPPLPALSAGGFAVPVALDRRWISGFSKPNYTTNKLRPAPSKTSGNSPSSAAEQIAKKKKHAAKGGQKDPFVDFNPGELLFKQIRGLAELPVEHHDPKLVFHLIDEARQANYKLISLDLAEALTIIDSFSLDSRLVDCTDEPTEADQQRLNIEQLLTVCDLIEAAMPSFAPREISIVLVHLAAIREREGDRFHLPLSFWPKCQGQLLSKKSLLTPALLSTLLHTAGQLSFVPTLPFFAAVAPHLQKGIAKLSPVQYIDAVIGIALLDFPISEELNRALTGRIDSILTYSRTEELPPGKREEFLAASTRLNLLPA